MSYNLTESQYTRILTRLTTLEEYMNDLTTAISQLVTLQQVQELLVTLQTTLDDINQTLSSLEDRVIAIEQEPLT